MNNSPNRLSFETWVKENYSSIVNELHYEARCFAESSLQITEDLEIDGHWHYFNVNGKDNQKVGYCGEFADTSKGVPQLSLTINHFRDGALVFKDDVVNRLWGKYKSEHETTAPTSKLPTRLEAVNTYKSLPGEGNSEYLIQKGVQPTTGIRFGTYNGVNCLYVPMMNAKGEIKSIQLIADDKIFFGRPMRNKHFPKGTVKKGLFFQIGTAPKNSKIIVVCEGIATGLAIAQSGIADCVLCAFDSGNMKHVAQYLNAVKLSFVVAADNDHKSSGKNSGLETAIAIAQKFGNLTAIPPAESLGDGTDFNDLFGLMGAENTKMVFHANTMDAATLENLLVSTNNTPKANTARTPKPSLQPEPQWTDPTPIMEKNESIAEVTEDMLPKNVSQWVNDVAKRMWIYPTYPSVALISFVSAIIARRVAIHPKKYDVEWRVIPNIWGAIVGQPGVQKSPALTPMFEPIARFQKHLKDEYNEALKQHKKELQQWKLQPKTTRGEKPTEPALRVLSVNDATMEAIHLAHLTNPQGLLLYRDELSGLIAEMGKQGREGQRQFFLEGWNGNGQYSMMRLSRENVDVEGLCLTIFGGIQPNILAQYIANTSTGKADDGFIQRFQLLVNSVPKADYKLIDVAPDYDGKAMFDKTIDRLLYLPMHGDPVITAFSDDAQPRFNAWLENLERRIRANTMPSILTSHISKYRSLLPSLALVFETISNEEFNLENMRDGKLLPRVSLESLELGIRWCDFLETHARSMLLDSPCEASPSALLAEKLIQKYKSGKWKDGATERSIKRLSRAKMDNQYFDDALELLHEFGYIKIEQHQPKRGGTPSNIIIVNPAITNDHQKAVKPAETEVPMANPQPNPQPELREKLLGIWNDQSCQTLEQVLARLESIDEISEQAWDNISILLSDFKSESNPTTTLKYDRDIFLRQVAEYSGLPSRV